VSPRNLSKVVVTILLMGVKGLIWTTPKTKNNGKLESHIN
jgi:hypothetical protein